MTNLTMTTPTYKMTKINWDALILQPGAAGQMHFGNSKYSNAPSAAATVRANIISNDGWNIVDGGGV